MSVERKLATLTGAVEKRKKEIDPAAKTKSSMESTKTEPTSSTAKISKPEKSRSSVKWKPSKKSAKSSKSSKSSKSGKSTESRRGADEKDRRGRRQPRTPPPLESRGPYPKIERPPDRESFLEMMDKLSGFVKSYMKCPEQYPVSNDCLPGFLYQRLDTHPPARPVSFDVIMQDFEKFIIPGVRPV